MIHRKEENLKKKVKVSARRIGLSSVSGVLKWFSTVKRVSNPFYSGVPECVILLKPEPQGEISAFLCCADQFYKIRSLRSFQHSGVKRVYLFLAWAVLQRRSGVLKWFSTVKRV